MHYSASLLTVAYLAISATASPAFYKADSDGKLTKLEARKSYGLGVNIYNQGGCAGNIQNVRNHDVNSCQYPSRAGTADNWKSARDKKDGLDKGYGCMSTFTDSNCNSGGRYYYLNGDGACIDFVGTVKCVVVAERGSNGVCNLNPPTC